MTSQTGYRTHTCGELRQTHVGQTVTLSGWVQITRDFGKFIFADLRDRHGITQVAVAKSEGTGFYFPDDQLYDQLKGVGREYVLQVTGTVRERENKNPNIPTGDVEIIPTKVELLNPALVPPFKIENDTDGGEELRLQYRYLDLRRPVLANSLILRAQVAKAVRQYLDDNGFLEIETPILIKATPEGARDFVVPSRLQQGSFYALPQSPQILKQLLMVGGMDRYYQICKCFRDEDFRGDRQPEFTQIDCEMSFVEQEDILRVFGGMIRHVFKAVKAIDLPELPRITYAECLEKYGSDKPDLRFGNPIVGLSELAQGKGFPVFAEALEAGGIVAGIRATACGNYSRKQTDALIDFVKEPHRGLKGLVTVKVNDDGTYKSSADKFLTPEALASYASALDAQPGDLLLLAAGPVAKVRKSLGDLRLHLAKAENWIPENAWSVFFVVDFPLFERDEETGALIPVHHPFVMPHKEDLHLLDTRPDQVRALCYDMVINGNELMSGSIRIHRSDVQDRIFQYLGLSEEERQQKFGFLLNAFKYGAPPHGGCAFGLDRLIMLLAGGETIRDAMAFPKNSAGRDLMLDAPGPVEPKDLDILGIKIKG